MTNDEINRAVALELGWTDVKLPPQPYWGPSHRGIAPGDSESSRKELPNFCTEHSAAAELRKFVMQQPCIDKYITALAVVLRTSQYSLSRSEVWAVIAATPMEQAEAFLRMRGKWVEKGKV